MDSGSASNITLQPAETSHFIKTGAFNLHHTDGTGSGKFAASKL
jgi:hypothetical protein